MQPVALCQGSRRSIDDFAEGGTAGHCCADLRAEILDYAASVGCQRLLHLHCLEYHNQVADLYSVTIGNCNLDDGALHG